MNVMVIGGGGREHALTWKLAESSSVDRIFVAAGNAETKEVAKAENVNIAATIKKIGEHRKFARQNDTDLVVVQLDNLLADGFVDAFQEDGLAVFGPTRAAVQIESSKSFAKEIMAGKVPTAEAQIFTIMNDALAYARNMDENDYPKYIKADGLAYGKGAIRADGPDQAEQIIKDMMERKMFGEAGETILIEEPIAGDEASLHAFCDGQSYKMMPVTMDHKPIDEGDSGKNTGGMGAVGPVYLPGHTLESLGEKFVAPILRKLNERDTPFQGVLYPGLKGVGNYPKIVEYNARFGDPEAQVYMRLLKSDLLEIMMACVTGKLEDVDIKWHDQAASCVVVASGGYPEEYETGYPIQGLEKAKKAHGVEIFHAGTEKHGDEVRTAGGRVLGVTAVANTLIGATRRANFAARQISFADSYYRRDIGNKAIPYSRKHSVQW